MKNRTKKRILAIIGLAVIALVLGRFVLTGSVLQSGWELKTGITQVQAEDRLITYSTQTAEFGTRGASQWTFDPDPSGTSSAIVGGFPVEVDNQYIRMPDIIISSSGVSHVNYAGQVTESKVPVDSVTLEVVKNDTDTITRYYDLHLFSFTVTMRTNGDKSTQYGIVFSETTADSTYEAFDGSVYISFTIEPWEYRSEDGTLEDAWAGIMTARITDIEQGLVEGTASPDTEWKVTPYYSEGSQVNMFSMDDQSVSGVSFNPELSPDPDIQQSVQLEFGAMLKNGANLVTNFLGIPVDVDVSNVFVKYTVQVEVMMVHEFHLETSPNPEPGEDDPEEDGSDREPVTLWGILGDLGASFLDSLQSPLTWIVIVIFGAGILIVLYNFTKRKSGVLF